VRSPPKENETLETEVVAAVCEIFEHMREAQTTRPQPILEKHLRPRVRRVLLLAAIAEAQRCEAYGKIGSPRVTELKSQLNAINFEIAKLNGPWPEKD
jgi:hypothetical protein